MKPEEQAIITQLAQAFRAHGKELYLVGGTVRDEIMGRESHDIDCATDALPDEIKAIVATIVPLNSGERFIIVPIGEKFGTIQLIFQNSTQIEITTYRGERYTPGSRKPEVQFGDDLLEDLRRRDFTINAIAKNALTGEIVDPFCGQSDIALGFIKAVDDPEQRFRDDPLRMLRAVRFAAQFGFIITSWTSAAILFHAHELDNISQERIRDEFCKILLGPNVFDALNNLLGLGLFSAFLSEVVDLEDVGQWPHHTCNVFDHTVLVVQQTPPDLEVRLAALLHDIAKPQTRTVDERGVTHFYEHEDIGAEMTRTILRRLRFGNSIVEDVAKMVKLHMRVNAYTPQWSNGAVRRLFIDAGEELILDLLNLAIADGTSDRNEPPEVVRERMRHLLNRLAQVQAEAGQHPLVSPLDGEELMKLFGKGPGPWLKPLKQHLNDLVVEGSLHPEDKESAMAAARVYMSQQAIAKHRATKE